MRTAHETVVAYWAAAEARDRDAFGALVAPDVVYEAPAARERVRGRAGYVRFNEEGFPGDWHLEVVGAVGEGRHAATWIRFEQDGKEDTGLCFFELDEAGLIARIHDFWPEPYEPPPGRGHLVERF
jgi:ketosteroid isomerase-like protein